MLERNQAFPSEPRQRILVTGAAGFIGSHLAERLAADGHDVLGLDCITDYYDAGLKRSNAAALAAAGVPLAELDLRTDDLATALVGVDAVVHAAAMPGLTRSWSDLQSYSDCNVVGTGRLVDACLAAGVHRVVHLSTSSVYGRVAAGDEASPVEPASPYGVTKLAAEQLLWAHAATSDLQVTILRLFSVYGPRQRPDMAYTTFIKAMTAGQPVTVHGDGLQTRSNTYVGDCVDAICRTLSADPAAVVGETINIGGGHVVSVLDVLDLLAEVLGVAADVRRGDARPGDQLHTKANTAKAARLLGWEPSTSPAEGLAAQAAWFTGTVALAT